MTSGTSENTIFVRFYFALCYLMQTLRNSSFFFFLPNDYVASNREWTHATCDSVMKQMMLHVSLKKEKSTFC